MIPAAIITFGCLVILALFIAITWSYDRGFADGRDERLAKFDDDPAHDTPPLDEPLPRVRE